MNYKKFACDIDGVITDFTQKWLEVINKKYSIHLTKKSINTYNFILQYTLTNSEREYIYLNSRPMPGAKMFTDFMKINSDMCFLTARGNEPYLSYKNSITDTKNWLNIHGFGKIPVIFEPNKVEFCKNNGIDVLLDDNPELCNHMGINTQHPTKLFLYNQPWNNSISNTKVIRILNYSDAIIKFYNS